MVEFYQEKIWERVEKGDEQEEKRGYVIFFRHSKV
jgi:hypothetical protein